MNTELIYQKTLQDLIKGIRANKKDPSTFISTSIADIKTELKSPDPRVKTQAVLHNYLVL
jgi:AP-3 complex subunit delta-1